MQTIRIGILGAGSIAGRWMRDAHTVPGAAVTCIASRELARAQAFAEAWHIPHALGGYEALVRHPEVDVVYVATPHPFHLAHAELAMRAGKHVLCEKPVALNAAQLAHMLACARAQGVFFMEAMWTRLFPVNLRVKELLAQGAIGTLRAVHAQFAFRTDPDPASRLLNPALGGGALLDVGCYPISYAVDMFGEAPEQVCGTAHIGQTGVDEQNAVTLRFPGGGLALLFSAVRTGTPTEAVLYGTEGSLRVPEFYHPTQVFLTRGGTSQCVYEDSFAQEGFAYELAHVCDCVRKGLLESPRMPHADSMAVMRITDTLRAQWGLTYPGETEG